MRVVPGPAALPGLVPPELSPISRALAAWDGVVHRLTCWGEGCRVAFYDGVKVVHGAAQGGASATWQAVCASEGQFIYNLFRRQLAVFIPAFDPMTQIEADVFMQRSFYLRDLHMSPAALSVLIPLAPPGLNYSRFFVSEVRVGWVNLLSLDENPIVLEIERVEATAAEVPAGSPQEVEHLVTTWLDTIGGNTPVPFRGRYPLLDGATFRVKRVELSVDSPTRYGRLRLALSNMEIIAVDGEGRQLGLSSLCKAGLSEDYVTFNRLIDCEQVSAHYVSGDDDGSLEAEPVPGVPHSGPGGRHYLLDPTPLAALLTQKARVEDLRHVVAQRWTLAFPGATRLHALPPLLTSAPELGPPDPRLSPFPAPATEWRIRIAEHLPFHWGSRFSRGQFRPHMHPIAAMVFTAIIIGLLLAFSTTVTPRPWFRVLLSRPPLLGHLFC